jgi:hypothetical protein
MLITSHYQFGEKDVLDLSIPLSLLITTEAAIGLTGNEATERVTRKGKRGIYGRLNA